MSSDAVALTGFVTLFALMLLRVPIGMALGLVGVGGFDYLTSGGPARKIVPWFCTITVSSLIAGT